MKKILIALVAVIVIAVGANFLFPSVNSLTDFKHINYTETFDQKESEYYVYFYQETCPLCLQFSPELVAAYNEKDVPIYVVDAAATENKAAWYDWAAHDKKYTKVIGKVENGVQVFNEGEDGQFLQIKIMSLLLIIKMLLITVHHKPQKKLRFLVHQR